MARALLLGEAEAVVGPLGAVARAAPMEPPLGASAAAWALAQGLAPVVLLPAPVPGPRAAT